VAQDERSQLRNRELAVERLVEQLRRALQVERRRVPTKPTEASRRRRLEDKQRRSQTKRLRRGPDD
jgi:ribosome-associated protein